jgi:hypothetical protein
MILDDIVTLIVEFARNAKVVDDEKLDPRLVEDWIMLKRNKYIKNYFNEKGTIEQNTIQFEILDVESIDTYLDALTSPYLSLGKKMMRTTICPRMIEGKNGVATYELTTADVMSRTIPSVPMDRLRWCGNGVRNYHDLFAAFYDDRFYIKSGSEIDKPIKRLRVVAVFADPREVSTYNRDTDDYPVNDYMIDYMKNEMLQQEFNWIKQQAHDSINNANGEVQTQG